jgi:hypothetical protein
MADARPEWMERAPTIPVNWGKRDAGGLLLRGRLLQHPVQKTPDGEATYLAEMRYDDPATGETTYPL